MNRLVCSPFLLRAPVLCPLAVRHVFSQFSAVFLIIFGRRLAFVVRLLIFAARARKEKTITAARDSTLFSAVW